VLITDHEYQSLPNELERVCAEKGAVVVKAEIPFPITDASNVVEQFCSKITPRTRLAFISHVTSGTSLVFPVAAIVRELHARGIDVCIDGAHSPGQIPVDLGALKPTYFIGSGHKWLSGPKGIGFLYVRSDKQAAFRPLQLSSRVSKVRLDRAMFLRDFDYQGTLDYSHFLTLSESIKAMGKLLPGGWPQLMRENHEKIMAAREMLAPMLEPVGCIVRTSPEQMVGTMTSIIIPEAPQSAQSRTTLYDDPMQDALYERHGIVTPVWRFNPTNSRVVRVSAQIYNTPEQYRYFGAALQEEIARERAL
jgi:isopenicillin-N epimerase